MDTHGCVVSANTFVLLKIPPKAKDGTQPPQFDTRCLRIAKDRSRIIVTGNTFSRLAKSLELLEPKSEHVLCSAISASNVNAL